MTTFAIEELETFFQNGFVAVPNLVDSNLVQHMLALTNEFAKAEIPPIEYEADLGYPGAPSAIDAPGGRTIRRLRQAISRHPVFFDWATSLPIANRVRQILGPNIVMPLAHHNCIMVKHPRFSSDTGWHQDIRYWGFQRPDLVSVILALTPACIENGCLRFLPGTHTMDFQAHQLDELKFLRTDLPENQKLLNTAVGVDMNPGDVVFFHSKTFHAATRNRSNSIRTSVLFTYRPADNPPVSGTRSADMPELFFPQG
jgi:phytanoyl-CoA hydroxylase